MNLNVMLVDKKVLRITFLNCNYKLKNRKAVISHLTAMVEMALKLGKINRLLTLISASNYNYY